MSNIQTFYQPLTIKQPTPKTVQSQSNPHPQLLTPLDFPIDHSKNTLIQQTNPKRPSTQVAAHSQGASTPISNLQKPTSFSPNLQPKNKIPSYFPSHGKQQTSTVQNKTISNSQNTVQIQAVSPSYFSPLIPVTNAHNVYEFNSSSYRSPEKVFTNFNYTSPQINRDGNSLSGIGSNINFRSVPIGTRAGESTTFVYKNISAMNSNNPNSNQLYNKPYQILKNSNPSIYRKNSTATPEANNNQTGFAYKKVTTTTSQINNPKQNLQFFHNYSELPHNKQTSIIKQPHLQTKQFKYPPPSELINVNETFINKYQPNSGKVVFTNYESKNRIQNANFEQPANYSTYQTSTYRNKVEPLVNQKYYTTSIQQQYNPALNEVSNWQTYNKSYYGPQYISQQQFNLNNIQQLENYQSKNYANYSVKNNQNYQLINNQSQFQKKSAKLMQVQMVDEIQRPKYNKLYSLEDQQHRRQALDEDPPVKKSLCTPLCWIPLLIVGFLLALLGMLCGMGVICPKNVFALTQAPLIVQDSVKPSIVPFTTLPSKQTPNIIIHPTDPQKIVPSVSLPTQINKFNTGVPSNLTQKIVPGFIAPLNMAPNFHPVSPILPTTEITKQNLTVNIPNKNPQNQKPVEFEPSVVKYERKVDEYYVNATPSIVGIVTNGIDQNMSASTVNNVNSFYDYRLESQNNSTKNETDKISFTINSSNTSPLPLNVSALFISSPAQITSVKNDYNYTLSPTVTATTTTIVQNSQPSTNLTNSTSYITPAAPEEDVLPQILQNNITQKQPETVPNKIIPLIAPIQSSNKSIAKQNDTNIEKLGYIQGTTKNDKQEYTVSEQTVITSKTSNSAQDLVSGNQLIPSLIAKKQINKNDEVKTVTANLTAIDPTLPSEQILPSQQIQAAKETSPERVQNKQIEVTAVVVTSPSTPVTTSNGLQNQTLTNSTLTLSPIALTPTLSLDSQKQQNFASVQPEIM